ncbi:MAG: cobalamin biosynthesis bifunctional protein CbiET, partial [Boseongicola sp.]|nr:cobalamin biosynthesis bifunctional protein CbiET [Boseongicola sp.]
IFVGGGLSENLLEQLETHFDAGTRVVINCVTLEAEALLVAWQSRKGGELMRVEISETKPLGAKRGWSAAYPVVQWAGQL